MQGIEFEYHLSRSVCGNLSVEERSLLFRTGYKMLSVATFVLFVLQGLSLRIQGKSCHHLLYLSPLLYQSFVLLYPYMQWIILLSPYSCFLNFFLCGIVNYNVFTFNKKFYRQKVKTVYFNMTNNKINCMSNEI